MALVWDFVNNFLNLLDAMSIYILIGLFIAGVLKQIIPDDFVSSHLGKSSTSSVVKATIFGIPLPVCSCSVIPLAQGLKKEGASKGSVQSFLISSPITGVDSILATYSFFGLFFTVYRVISSIIIAIVTGLLQNLFDKKDSSKINFTSFSVDKPKEENSKDSCCSSNSSCSTSNEGKKSFFKSAFSYAYGTLFSDMAKSLLIGLILGALFTTFLPKEYAKLLFDNTILTYFVILIFAIPLYTCATASLPIAAALMIQGMSAGAAFIFLTAGPATSAITMSIVYKMLGKRSLIIYLTSMIILSLLFGFFFDVYFSNLDILMFDESLEEKNIFNSLSSMALLLLIAYHLLKDKFIKNKTSSCCEG